MLADASNLDPAFVLSNRIEAGLWTAIGVGFLIGAALHHGIVRRDALIAAMVFAIFGLSDVVEATTGAWWRPWWLLVWKGGCIVALLVLTVRYFRRRRPWPHS